MIQQKHQQQKQKSLSHYPPTSSSMHFPIEEISYLMLCKNALGTNTSSVSQLLTENVDNQLRSSLSIPLLKFKRHALHNIEIIDKCSCDCWRHASTFQLKSQSLLKASYKVQPHILNYFSTLAPKKKYSNKSHQTTLATKTYTFPKYTYQGKKDCAHDWRHEIKEN